MRKVVLWTTGLAIAFSLAVTVAAADDDSDHDARLDQPVTIQCVDVRLHTAVEQLSRLTGVRLNCGRNKEDWQVRDVPVVVCGKDVPLGKLLRAIAETTHLALTSQETASGRSYRIWRNGTRARELADYEKKERDWGYAMAAWQWDVVARLKDVPNSAFAGVGLDYERRMLSGSGFKDVSPILAMLGPEVRDRVLAGEQIRITTKDPPEQLTPLVEHYLRTSWAAAYRELAPYHPDLRLATDEDLRNATLVIESPPRSEDERPSIEICAEGPVRFRQTHLGNISIIALTAKDYLPKEPEEPKPRYLEYNPQAKTWGTKILLKPPKDKQPVTFSDACVALADATGLTVVAENFHGHKTRDPGQDVFARFRTDTELSFLNACDLRLAWHVDDNNKVLMCSNRRWPLYHRGLAPERIIEGLNQKLDGDGAGLDDVTPLARLTKWQANEWVDQSRYLNMFHWPFAGPDQPLWAFYERLTPDEKEQVKSDEGLYLGEEGVVLLAGILKEREQRMRGTSVTPTKVKWWEEAAGPQDVSDVVMRIKSDESQGPGNRKQHRYTLEFVGEYRSEPFSISAPLPWAFPIYSEKREAELLKTKRACRAAGPSMNARARFTSSC